MEGCLWKAYGGRVELHRLQPFTVIDRCAASVGDLQFKVGSGGTRIYGKRPLVPDESLRHQNLPFFTSLKASLQAEGQKLPILVWGINGKLYVRYGASRVWAAKELGWRHLAAVVSVYGEFPLGFQYAVELQDPADILETGFWGPSVVGDFEASHERLDAHRMEPAKFSKRYFHGDGH
jgi:hypothetical protein